MIAEEADGLRPSLLPPIFPIAGKQGILTVYICHTTNIVNTFVVKLDIIIPADGGNLTLLSLLMGGINYLTIF